MYGYIYLTVNNINHKIYIGQHISESFDIYYKGSGKAITNAFKKYGKSNFTTTIICECDSLEELNEMELYFIAEYNSTDKSIGYNIRVGGNNSPWPEEVKQKMSESAKGKTFSEESCKKMSDSKKGNHNNHGCNKGRLWIHNENEQFFIEKDELDYYLSKGYSQGMINKVGEKLEEYRNKYANRIFINDSEHEKYIHEEELEFYLSNGWKVGRLNVYSQERGNNISKSKKGTIKITNGTQVKYIKPELLNQYVELGFYQPHKKNTL